MLWWFDLVAAAAIAALGIHWVVERRRLFRFVASEGPSLGEPEQRALAFAARISNRPWSPKDPPYLAPALAPFGATPSAVLQRGGCCSGTSRLYILCLAAIGIRANQITVYHRSGNAQHCLVEVRIPGGRLIADPVYGVYYTDGTGRRLGLEDLQAGVPVICALLPGTIRSGYPHDDYYNFDFALTKTANWTMSWQRRLAYTVLRASVGGSVDRLRVPAILEWPQVLLIVPLLGATIFVHCLAVLAH